MSEYFFGIDIGSSYTKACILDANRKVLAQRTIKTGISFENACEKVKELVVSDLKISGDQLTKSVSTGVGRKNVAFAQFNKPELNCISKACYFYFPQASTIIDIGGQDNKLIIVAADGKQKSFKMNRKCASGTGSFLEEMSLKLDLGLTEMNERARSVKDSVKVSSFCTVFAATEIIHHIRNNSDTNQIIRGVFESVIKRVFEMGDLSGTIILSGGTIEKNPMLIQIFGEKLNSPPLVPPAPQMIGAIGAALYGVDEFEKENA
ncbi:MAG: ATPase [Bacteriovoracaceae bacterium]|jgi:(R)-2-hydroxyacyl-CoA dehydratese activating ATPase|nr:ATPase [Bacteriovoracaceae bacterium]